MGISRKALFAVFIVTSLILLCLPRFNRNDHGLKRIVGEGFSDHEQYVLFVEYFRGNAPAASLMAPYTYRPLVPLIASSLPFSATTSINLINVVCLMLTTLYLYRTLSLLGIEPRYCMVGCYLFVFSFPTFYYGAIGYLEPVLLLVLTAGTYCIVSGRWLALCLLIALGVAVKETVVILIPVAVASIWVGKTPKRHVALQLSVMVACYLGATLICRVLSPDPNRVWFWIPSFSERAAGSMMANLFRPKTYLSLFLTLGLPGLGAALYLSKLRLPRFLERVTSLAPLITGIAMSVSLWAYAFVSAYADGRYIWPSYPFAIPLATLWLSNNQVLERLLSIRRGDGVAS